MHTLHRNVALCKVMLCDANSEKVRDACYHPVYSDEDKSGVHVA